MTPKVTQGNWNSRYVIGHHFLLVVCSNNVSILGSFRDITTLSVRDCL